MIDKSIMDTEIIAAISQRNSGMPTSWIADRIRQARFVLEDDESARFVTTARVRGKLLKMERAKVVKKSKAILCREFHWSLI